MRIDVGGWEVGGRLSRGPDADEARVRLVSAATQNRHKFALKMGRPGHKTDQMGLGRRTLGRLVFSFCPKRTRPERMGSCDGVGLIAVVGGVAMPVRFGGSWLLPALRSTCR